VRHVVRLEVVSRLTFHLEVEQQDMKVGSVSRTIYELLPLLKSVLQEVALGDDCGETVLEKTWM
jgi:hypothetical protein